jgi:choline kinase
MRAIILAAGEGFLLDGMVKCLVRAPHDGRPLLERMIDGFARHTLTVVVGYRAVDVMQQYPDLDYVYNADWATTNNSYSLGLALNDEPCYVLSSDLVFESELVDELDAAAPNLVLTEHRENRIPTSVSCALAGDRVMEFYTGPIRAPADPEAMGVYKVSEPSLLRRWKRNCLKHSHLFAGQNLALGEGAPELYAHDVASHLFYEINSPADYLRALRLHRAPAFA